MQRLRWIFKRLPAIALAVILTGLVVIVLDFIWFRSMVPISFTDARWSGVWKTHQFMGLTGRLLVRMPDPLPEEGDFKAEALIYYPIYSVYRTGQFVRIDFVGNFSGGATVSAGETTTGAPSDPPDYASKGKSGKLYFAGSAGGMFVEYSALIDRDANRIVGGYLSSGPYDYGFFSVERW